MGCTGSSLRSPPTQAAVVPLSEQQSPTAWSVAEHHVTLAPPPVDTGDAELPAPTMPENPRQDSVQPMRNAIDAMGGWGEESQLQSPKHHKAKPTI